jgi:hypothetical protein
MKFRFDPSQEYQLEAIRSVADLFEGQRFIRGGVQLTSGAGAPADALVPHLLRVRRGGGPGHPDAQD